MPVLVERLKSRLPQNIISQALLRFLWLDLCAGGAIYEILKDSLQSLPTRISINFPEGYIKGSFKNPWMTNALMMSMKKAPTSGTTNRALTEGP